MLAQYALVFLICTTSVLFSNLFSFPLPVSVCSMLLTFLLLAFHAIKPQMLQIPSNLLLGNMALLFVPSGVGILAHTEIIQGKAIILIVICLISTLITFAAALSAAWATKHLLDSRKRPTASKR